MISNKLLAGSSSEQFAFSAAFLVFGYLSTVAHLGCVVDRAIVSVVVDPGTVAAVDVFAPLVVVVTVVVVHLMFFLLLFFAQFS